MILGPPNWICNFIDKSQGTIHNPFHIVEIQLKKVESSNDG